MVLDAISEEVTVRLRSESTSEENIDFTIEPAGRMEVVFVSATDTVLFKSAKTSELSISRVTAPGSTWRLFVDRE